MEITKTFFIDNNLNNLGEINRYLEQELETLDQPMCIIFAVEVSFEEIFTNICNYAYQGNEGKIVITIQITDNEIKITFEDKGIKFDPLNKEDPDTHASIEERPIGGLGIYLTKKKMDEFNYEYREGTNINTLVKHLI